jgi:hypothetical protein
VQRKEAEQKDTDMHRRFFLVGAPLALAACAGRWETSYDTQLTADVTRGWTVSAVKVSVPQSLRVSDVNRVAPNADIVWHGDPEGDRRQQVSAIVQDGITGGAAELAGPRAVTFSVTLLRFHGVTPAAVAISPAAVHNISYMIQVYDTRTIQPLTPPVEIHADLDAFTQAAAIVAAQEGQTQKVRITNHIATVTRGWLGIGEDPRRSFTGLGR